jgi:8-oxo-dGTP pyrophosphatase MutT (NUDIX family)
MFPTGPNTYLLEKLMNKKYPQNLGKLRFPGGGVDPGETMQEAAVRELQEELKYKIDPSKLQYVGQDNRDTHNYEHYFKLLDHTLKPGKYTDAIGGDSTVYLTRKRPQGDKYFGADVNNLIKPNV